MAINEVIILESSPPDSSDSLGLSLYYFNLEKTLSAVCFPLASERKVNIDFTIDLGIGEGFSR